MNLIRLIKNLFKIAKLLSVDDSGDYQFMTVSTLGKTQKVLSFKPYGLMSNPPADSIVGLWSQQGQESNGIGMADDPKNRPIKNMGSGAVGLGNYITASYITFDESGDAILATVNDAITGASNDIILFASNDVGIFASVGKCTVSGLTIELNGSTYSLTMWEQLNAALQALMVQLNAHSHVGAGAVTGGTISIDVSAAAALTLRTNG